MEIIFNSSEEKKFDNNDILGQNIAGKEFFNCEFYKCDFSGCDSSGAVFNKCRFTGCNLSNIRVGNCSFKGVNFENCKLLGILFNEINQFMLDWSFNNCLIEFCNFDGLKMKNSRFLRCNIRESDFTNAYLAKSDFGYSDLELSVIRNANLEGANFIGAKNYYINPTQNKLKGAKFSLPEALSLLAAFEIKIE